MCLGYTVDTVRYISACMGRQIGSVWEPAFLSVSLFFVGAIFCKIKPAFLLERAFEVGLLVFYYGLRTVGTVQRQNSYGQPGREIGY